MKLTIIPADNVVIIDGDPRAVDCSALRGADIHAIQWDGDAGAVEPKAGPQFAIDTVELYADLIAAHAARKAADIAAAAAAAAALPAPRDLVAELDALRARVNALDGQG